MKRWIGALCAMGLLLGLAACSFQKNHTDKLKDLDFTVLKEEEIPEELKTVIDEKKTEPMKITYTDQGYLYIAAGYGKQDTSGYSITVNEFYETENTICIHTRLLGPKKDEKVSKKATYPYLVVKTEAIEKTVEFE